MQKSFQVHPEDNVATVIEEGGAVPMGHKVAMKAIAAGATVVKFGVPIGVATREIGAGDWVHLHNCRSQVDERSATLEVRTGQTTDTPYE